MADVLYVSDAEGTRPRTDNGCDGIIMSREWYIEQLRQAWDAGNAAGS